MAAPTENGTAQVVYRIRNWSRYFENNRSRELKNAWWVPLPNFMGEDGYAELLDHPDGPAHYGVWCACVQIAAKAQCGGSLVRDGGAPHTHDSLARICRMPAELVRDACGRLAVIGWMEQVTVTKDTYLDGAANLRDARAVGAATSQNHGRSRARVDRRGENNTTPPLPPSVEGGGRRPTKKEQHALEFEQEQKRRLGLNA